MSGVIVLNDINVSSAEQQYQIQSVYEIDSPSNTRQKITIAHTALALDIQYMQGGAATGKFLYFVFNALNDYDAAFRLATKGLRQALPVGDSKTFKMPSGVTRIDFITEVAETGSSKLFIQLGR